jgi:hypothetical protein
MQAIAPGEVLNTGYDLILKSEHDAALRRAKAEVWREAIMGVTNLKADMENGVPPSERMGFSRACNEIIGYARAAQIEEGSK